MTDVLEALQATLEARKSASADSSYVAGLYQQGLNKILEKLGEEAMETILSAKDYDCLLYTSPSPRDKRQSRMPSSA